MSQPSPSNFDRKIEALTDQVGRMIEGITEFRLEIQRSMTDLKSGMVEFKDEMQRSRAEFRADLA